MPCWVISSIPVRWLWVINPSRRSETAINHPGWWDRGALDKDGVPRFQLLQQWQKRPTAPVVFFLYRNGKLRYFGHSGTGFSEKGWQKQSIDWGRSLPKNRRLENPPKIPEKIQWVQPKLVCEVAFAEWTEDEQLRQTTFLGWRDDKSPEEVVIDARAIPNLWSCCCMGWTGSPHWAGARRWVDGETASQSFIEPDSSSVCTRVDQGIKHATSWVGVESVQVAVWGVRRIKESPPLRPAIEERSGVTQPFVAFSGRVVMANTSRNAALGTASKFFLEAIFPGCWKFPVLCCGFVCFRPSS